MDKAWKDPMTPVERARTTVLVEAMMRGGFDAAIDAYDELQRRDKAMRLEKGATER